MGTFLIAKRVIQLKVLIGSVPVPVREETQPAGLTGGVQIDEPLVAAASKPQLSLIHI